MKTITSDNGVEFAGLSTLLKDITEVISPISILHRNEEPTKIIMG
ncbi:hypothetical protein D358_00604 [Enterococcus faecalis RP2S-4]|uniref:Transposase n=1 Tax=Enterococcus faecalis RP2S-4 TaxID=1244145 RepID=A0ABC9TNU8_ENTFL|nr:hypothetical protein D358_00604 [Enterococcus faecalis RP2S-4]